MNFKKENQSEHSGVVGRVFFFSHELDSVASWAIIGPLFFLPPLSPSYPTSFSFPQYTEDRKGPGY